MPWNECKPMDERLRFENEAISFAFCGHFLTVVTKGRQLVVENLSWSVSVADKAGSMCGSRERKIHARFRAVLRRSFSTE